MAFAPYRVLWTYDDLDPDVFKGYWGEVFDDCVIEFASVGFGP